MKHKKTWIISAIVISVILIAAVFASSRKGPKTVYQTSAAETGSIIQTVSETGTVKSSEELDLSFLLGGKIENMVISVGDSVKTGDILARLDDESYIIKKKEAEASVSVARANLNKLLSGSTAEEKRISEAGAKQAKTAYEASVKEQDRTKESLDEGVRQAEKTLYDLTDDSPSTITTYEQAVASARTSLENTKATYQKNIDDYKESYITTLDEKNSIANTALDQISTIFDDDDLENQFSIKDLKYKQTADSERKAARSLLEQADDALEEARSDNTNEKAMSAIEKSLSALNKIFSALDNTYKALENTITGGNLSTAELDAHKSTLSTQIGYISTAISAVQSVRQNLDTAILNYNTNATSAQDGLDSALASYENAVLTAQNSLKSAQLSREQQLISAQSKVDNAFEAWQVAQRQYEKVLAGANEHDINLARAQLSQAEASLNSINKQLSDTVLKAPQGGVITTINFESGEQAAAGQTVLSMLGQGKFEIEVLISEADIAKVSLGDQAVITLDAFGEDIKFKGQVDFIEPAETVIQDVIYYNIKVRFSPEHEQAESDYYKDIKSGMTANVTLTTAFRDNALIIPSRAVIDKNGDGKFVRILAGSEAKEVPVRLGLRGDDGLVEVVSGLKAGDLVITRITEE